MIHDPYLDAPRQERGCLGAVTLGAVALVLCCLAVIAAAIVYAVRVTVGQ